PTTVPTGSRWRATRTRPCAPPSTPAATGGGCSTRPWTGRRARTRSGLDQRLHLDAQVDGHVEAVFLAEGEAEGIPLEAAAGVGAAHLLLEHGVLDAAEVADVEIHRRGDAVEGEVALEAGGCAVGEIPEGAGEGGVGEPGGIEQLLAAGLLVHLFVAEIHAVDVDDDVDGAGLRLPVEHHLAAGGVELAPPEGQAHVVRLEAGVGVGGVDLVGHRGGEGAGAGKQPGQGDGAGDSRHGVTPWQWHWWKRAPGRVCRHRRGPQWVAWW